ncbi:tautomerase family protein [Dechloromonas sp. A34]|uniref:tautomerase family protein n=1 Tax=Dechloromonas sp. A34 TaxID=447588 RepID=UPI0022498190|nr:2-hydroxymuconate tautomerase family protein [Dechloromonas sp. A34]
MPIIEMHLLEGRSVEKKRKAVAAITAALVESLEVKADTVRILITEHPVEHFAVAGVTVGQRNEVTCP